MYPTIITSHIARVVTIDDCEIKIFIDIDRHTSIARGVALLNRVMLGNASLISICNNLSSLP